MNRRFRFNKQSKKRMKDYEKNGTEPEKAEENAPQSSAADTVIPTDALVAEETLAAARAEETSGAPFTVASRTHIGKVRKVNQDAVVVAGKLCGVADGMGGHQGGEIASAFARDALVEQLEAREPESAALVQAVKTVNRRLFIRSREEEGLRGMGTTLSVLWVGNQNMHIAHVGDSRVYRLHDGRLTQVTDDHSWVMEMVRAGMLKKEQAASHPMRNVITRAIGTEEGVDVDSLTLPRTAGDIWLVCSDGLHGLVSAVAMEETLKKYPIENAAERLLQAALDAGGHDNISLVIVYDREGAQ